MEFTVFEQEKLDGLEEIIINNAKAGQQFYVKTNNIPSIDKHISKASQQLDPTLHQLDSILCSIGTNENDDVFLGEEVYAARNSPVDKPVNVDHVAKDIIGHIKAYMLLDTDFNIIPEDTPFNELPEKFHLATSAVIYKSWEDDKEEERVLDIIEKANAGEKFVSMECFFKGFDYGLTNSKTNEKYVIARNKDTSFLTKALRIYGGSGKFKEYTVCRVLRNIVFNGKGIVDNPANKESIIFSNTSPFAHAKLQDNVYDILETPINKEMIMADTNDTLITELKASKANLEAKVAELEGKLSEVSTASVKTQIAELEKSVASKDSEIEALTKKVTDLETVKAEINAKLGEVTKTAEEATAKLDAIAKETIKNTRINTLVKAGLKLDDAVAKAEKFAALDDDMFGEVVALTKSSKTVPTETPESATASIIEGAEKTGDNTVAGGNDDNKTVEREKAQAALSSFLGNLLTQKK